MESLIIFILSTKMDIVKDGQKSIEKNHCKKIHIKKSNEKKKKKEKKKGKRKEKQKTSIKYIW